MRRTGRKSLDPFDAQLVGHSAGPMRGAAIAAMASLLARLAAGIALAHLTAALVMGSGFSAIAVVGLGLGAAASAGLAVLSVRLTARAEEEVAGRALAAFGRFFSKAPVRDVQAMSAGDLASRVARHPAAIAHVLVTGAQARMLSGFGAVAGLVLMALFSWSAALLLAAAMPVMIVFFVLVGQLTKTRADAQERALQTLSGRFADFVRCLPSLLASHRTEHAAADLEQALERHSRRAGALFGVAFLNSAVLDFFSALSVAILAVFLGLGHLGLTQMPGFHGLELAASLSVLVLAPEVFSALKRFAEQYHQLAEGREALAALRALAGTKDELDCRLPASRFAARNLRLAHLGAVRDFDLPAGGLVVLWGPSGCGKTTLLRALAGVDRPLGGQLFKPEGSAAWCAADAYLPEGEFGPLTHRVAGEELRLGLDTDARFGAGRQIAAGGSDLSGGQRLRIGLLRALESGAATIFADEPTAKLDPVNAERVRRALGAAGQDRLVITATHDPLLRERAGMVIDLTAREAETV